MYEFNKNQLIDIILSHKLYCDSRGNIYHEDYANYLSPHTGLWQFPDEYAELILYLSDKNIKTFLNIGTYNVIAFNVLASFLYKINQTKCISIDPINHNPQKNILFSYESCTSDRYVDQKFDLVFIDGDHAYESVKKDYNNVGQFARYCVFHDIDDDFIRNDSRLTGGSPRFWNEIKNTKKFIEINSFKKSIKIMGIGLLYE